MRTSDVVNNFLRDLEIDPFVTKLIEIKNQVVVVTTYALDEGGNKYCDPETKQVVTNIETYHWELSDDFKDSRVSRQVQQLQS